MMQGLREWLGRIALRDHVRDQDVDEDGREKRGPDNAFDSHDAKRRMRGFIRARVYPLTRRFAPPSPDGRGAKGVFTTRPPFMTNATRSSALMSRSGSPSSAMRSASYPGAMLPILSP